MMAKCEKNNAMIIYTSYLQNRPTLLSWINSSPNVLLLWWIICSPLSLAEVLQSHQVARWLCSSGWRSRPVCDNNMTEFWGMEDKLKVGLEGRRWKWKMNERESERGERARGIQLGEVRSCMWMSWMWKTGGPQGKGAERWKLSYSMKVLFNPHSLKKAVWCRIRLIQQWISHMQAKKTYWYFININKTSVDTEASLIWILLIYNFWYFKGMWWNVAFFSLQNLLCKFTV